MAYKFQLGTAHLSGAIVLDETSDQLHLSGGLDLAADALAVDSINITGATELATAGAVADADELIIHDNDAGVAKKVGIDTLKTVFSNAIDIDGLTALGGASIDQADNLLVSDGGTEKKVTFSNLEDTIFGNVSGDATVAAGGALTIANDAVEQAMIADDAVGADQLAANAVVNASIASDAAIDMDKLDGGSLASTLSDLAQGDLLYAGDVDDSNNLKSITFSEFEDAIFGNVSGDATIAAGGALTIAAGAVENSMLADDAVGADELASNAVVNASVQNGAIKADKLDLDGSTDIGAALADADLIIVDDGAGGTNRVAQMSRVKTYIADVTLTTAAQTAITSVGTLTGLDVDAIVTAHGLTFASSDVSGAHEVVAGGLRTTGSFIAGYSSSYNGPGGHFKVLNVADVENETLGGLVGAGRTSIATASVAAVGRPSYLSISPSGSEDLKLFVEPPSAGLAGQVMTVKFNGGQAGNVLVLTSSNLSSGLATGGDSNVLFDSLHALTMSSPMAAVNLLWNGSSYEIF